MTDIPSSLADVGLDWLNSQLDAAGHAVEASSMSIRPMDGFVGAMGEVGICDVTWSATCDLPTTFVAKCPSTDELAQLMNTVMQSYRREHGFYAELVDMVPGAMPVPTPYVNRHDDETGRAFLLIERVIGTPGDVFASCSPEAMAELLQMLARLHGRFWMSDDIADRDWMFDWNSPLWQMGIPMCEEHWPALNAAWPDMCPPDLKAAFDCFYINDINAALDRMFNRAWTFAHNDYQLDNVIFTDTGPVIIDWQTVMRSFPGIDVSWLLATGQSDATIAEEPALLDAYLQELADSGGPQWSRDELLEDMALGICYYVTGTSIPVDQQRQTLEPGDRARDRLEHFMFSGISAAQRWELAERLA